MFETDTQVLARQASQPKMDPKFYNTYGIRCPRETHTRAATCAEIDCVPYTNGWQTVLSVSGQPDMVDLVRHSGRKYVETREGDIITFTFEAGQRCFEAANHRTSLQRPPIFLVKHGDWRRSENVKQYRAEDWADHFATNQDRLNTAHQRRG